MHTYVYTYMYVCIYIYVHMCTYIMCICKCMYICMCTHMSPYMRLLHTPYGCESGLWRSYAPGSPATMPRHGIHLTVLAGREEDDQPGGHQLRPSWTQFLERDRQTEVWERERESERRRANRDSQRGRNTHGDVSMYTMKYHL